MHDSPCRGSLGHVRRLLEDVEVMRPHRVLLLALKLETLLQRPRPRPRPRRVGPFTSARSVMHRQLPRQIRRTGKQGLTYVHSFLELIYLR